MIAPEALIADLMKEVRTKLFAGRSDKEWFAQQELVKKALTYPAHWLEERKVPLASKRYAEIMTTIIGAAAAYGDLGKVTYVSRYLLTCVQRHMAHHGDEYYQEGKAIRNRTSVFMATLEKNNKPARAADRTVTVLSEVHASIAVGRRKAKAKAVAKPLQPDLF